MKVDASVGDEVFEFLAENTKVEWSNASLGEVSQSNHLTSSHDEDREYGMSRALTAFQEKGKVTVNYVSHSHPSNIPYPSEGDKKTAELFNTVSKQNIQYKIYLPDERCYVYY